MLRTRKKQKTFRRSSSFGLRFFGLSAALVRKLAQGCCEIARGALKTVRARFEFVNV